MTVNGFDKDRLDDVEKVVNQEWNVEDRYCGCDSSICLSGKGYLCGGVSEEEFAERLARAVMDANQGPCEVLVHATFLEDLPCGTYCFDEKDYDRWLEVKLPDWLFKGPVAYEKKSWGDKCGEQAYRVCEKEQ